MDDSTEAFLRAMNERNAAIAARQQKEKPQPDLVRLQREKEEREKWGQLRARTRSGNRPRRIANVFPYVDPS